MLRFLIAVACSLCVTCSFGQSSQTSTSPERQATRHTNDAYIDCNPGATGTGLLGSPRAFDSIITMRCGEKIAVLEESPRENEEWDKIETSGGNVGYVRRSFVSWNPPSLANGLSTSARDQDAAGLEAQYKTCAKHYIPADRCTPEIYRQLKNKDEAPLDPGTASALQAVKDYQPRLRNPASIQVRTAYVTDRGDVCLEIGGQNGMGGLTVSCVVYTSTGRWLDEGGLLGAMSRSEQHNGGVDRWLGVCTKGSFHPKLVAGTDVTEKVNQALKDTK